MNAQFKKGVIELCVLKALSEKEMSAFEVLHRISNELDVNENTVYPLLRRLEEEGYLFHEKTPSVRGAPRKYFHLTEQGKQHFEQLELAWRTFRARVDQILEGENHE